MACVLYLSLVMFLTKHERLAIHLFSQHIFTWWLFCGAVDKIEPWT